MAHGAGYAAAGGAPPTLIHHLPPPPPPTTMYASGPELLWKTRFQQPPHLAPVHHHAPHHLAAAAAVHHEYLTAINPHRDQHDRLHRGEAGGSPALPSSLTYYDTAAKLRDYRLAPSAPTMPRERREQEARELAEKQQKEKEREREKAEREERERERTREDAKLLQNDTTSKLVQKHFSESLRIAHEKRQDRERVTWSIIQNLPPGPAPGHERLRAPPAPHAPPSDPRDRYYPAPPAAHHRPHKPHPQQQQQQPQPQQQQHHPLPKAEPNFSQYPYYRNAPYEKKEGQHLPAPPPLLQESKNSVIVKHDPKQQILDHNKLTYAKRPVETVHYNVRPQYRPTQLPSEKPRPRVAYHPPPPRSPAFYCTAPPPHRPKVSSPAPPHMYGKPSPDRPPVPYPPPTAYSPAPRHLPPPPPAHSITRAVHTEPCQTQPLDLGVTAREDPETSPRRRAPLTPLGDVGDPKRRRLDSEPTPPSAIAAAAVSARAPLGSDPAPQAPGPPCDVRVPSADGSIETPEKAAGASPACVTPAASPAPASSPAAPTPPPAPAEPDPPAPSPGPPVRHLGKKAWLQRHETAPASDGDKSGGGGVCVTLPMSVAARVEPEETKPPTPPPAPSPVKSVLHRVGSMAVNSIGRTKTPKARKPAKETNGRRTEEDARDGEDSSSSEREAAERAPPKRKPPKTKRRKGGGTRKAADEPKKKKASESGSDSDKESDGDKDSDSGSGGGGGSRRGNGRARGRRARGSGGTRGAGGGRKRDDQPPRKTPAAARLRRSGESFLQNGMCSEVAPRLAKCRECRWSPQQRDKDMPNIFCRFYDFRRLRYAKNGQLAIAGFSDPYKDAEEEDKKLWLNSSGAADLDLEMSCFLLREIGDQFCQLLQQERSAETEYLLGNQPGDDKTIAWKRVVQGVREICDVCETTLFNLHWTCTKCGFVACHDCYKSRSSGEPSGSSTTDAAGSERDAHGWLTCTASNAPHAPRKLLLTQIAAGDALAAVAERAHRARAVWGLPACGACTRPPLQLDSARVHLARKLLRAAIAQNVKKEEIKEEGATNGSSPCKTENGGAVLSWLSASALEPEPESTSSSDSEGGNFSTLRELLVRPAPDSEQPPKKKHKRSRKDILEDVISSVVDQPEVKSENEGKGLALEEFVKKRYARGGEELTVRIMTLTESRLLYPTVPHSWLCDGKLLHLTDPNHPDNYKPFQDQWKRGQPVLVSDLLTLLDKDLWTPESFSRDFGDARTDLVNCASGLVVPNQPAAKFWDGFALAARRLRDDRGAPMVLKLKDWPPGEDFAELLPSRFTDLMNALPLKEYTARAGRLNLAARLPECFVRPDLGPKMYTAYGGAGGTTNLHLDVSDAVNVMVHASSPSDAPERAREASRAAEDAGADVLSRRRARHKPAGALWHIYAARDADKIRDLLLSAEVERGNRPRPESDPVHDQTWYLDAALRERLYREYGVEGYAVLQCPGDAVFVPAGAPHQVRNLLDCIKVAEDFVSPENVSRCFELAHQFRRLSRQHTNKEDKLQIKNIVYHAVKDSLCCLESALDAAAT